MNFVDHVKTSLNLEYPFVVTYEDKDFNNKLITLENMEIFNHSVLYEL